MGGQFNGNNGSTDGNTGINGTNGNNGIHGNNGKVTNVGLHQGVVLPKRDDAADLTFVLARWLVRAVAEGADPLPSIGPGEWGFVRFLFAPASYYAYISITCLL